MLGGASFEEAFEKLFLSLNGLKENIEEINSQFKNNVINLYYILEIDYFCSCLHTGVFIDV